MLEQVIKNTAGLYGDLQGMIGAALQTIESLELPQLKEIDTNESEEVAEVAGNDPNELPF